MKTSDLLTLWTAPDNTRLTAKQFSFRLPTHVAAKIQALCDMYPTKSRTDIVADLLAAALGDVARSFPRVKGKFLGTDRTSGVHVYEDVGISRRFRELVDEHYIAIENEQGNPDAKPLYGCLDSITEEIEDGQEY